MIRADVKPADVVAHDEKDVGALLACISCLCRLSCRLGGRLRGGGAAGNGRRLLHLLLGERRALRCDTSGRQRGRTREQHSSPTERALPVRVLAFLLLSVVGHEITPSISACKRFSQSFGSVVGGVSHAGGSGKDRRRIAAKIEHDARAFLCDPVRT